MTSPNTKNRPSVDQVAWYVVQEGGRARKLPGSSQKLRFAKYWKCDDIAAAKARADKLNAKWKANQASSDFQRRDWAAYHPVIGVMFNGNIITPDQTRELHRDDEQERAEFNQFGRTLSWDERLAN